MSFIVFLDAVFAIRPGKFLTEVLLIPRAGASDVVGGIGNEGDVFGHMMAQFMIEGDYVGRVPKRVVFRTKRTFSNFELCHTQKGERSLPVFRIIAGVPKNAIAVGADRTRDSLAATILCAMFCVRDVEFALVTTFVAMRLASI